MTERPKQEGGAWGSYVAYLDQLEGMKAAVEKVLEAMVDEYFDGCKRYAAAAADGPDNATRVWWRIRLAVLSEYGDRLAAALGQAEPDWDAMRGLAGADDPVAYATGPADAFSGPVRPAQERDGMHDCPGGCGRRIVRNTLSCGHCWHRLPGVLRATYAAAYPLRRVSPAAYQEVQADCLSWFRANPPARPS